MELHDNNYHLMVNLLIKLICSRNNLRVEAPEWYPTKEVIGHDGRNIGTMNESKVCDMSGDKKDCHEWKKPKKVYREMKMNERRTDEDNKNYHEELSDEDDEEEDECEYTYDDYSENEVQSIIGYDNDEVAREKNSRDQVSDDFKEVNIHGSSSSCDIERIAPTRETLL